MEELCIFQTCYGEDCADKLPCSTNRGPANIIAFRGNTLKIVKDNDEDVYIKLEHKLEEYKAIVHDKSSYKAHIANEDVSNTLQALLSAISEIQIQNPFLTAQSTQIKSVISVPIKDFIHHYPRALFNDIPRVGAHFYDIPGSGRTFTTYPGRGAV